MNKEYKTPNIKCVTINAGHSILAASGDNARYKVNKLNQGETYTVGDDAGED